MKNETTLYKLVGIFKGNGYTQDEIARHILGCASSTLSGYIRCHHEMPYEYIAKLTQLFEIPKEKWGEIFLLPYMKAQSLIDLHDAA